MRLSWSLIFQDGDKNIPNNDPVKKDLVIKKIVQYGQGVTGDKFRLYVTAYGQIFNDQDPDCNTVTFAKTANLNADGKENPMMITDLRQEFNWMIQKLNAAIEKAVS